MATLTSLQATIDKMIADLNGLRSDPIVQERMISEDNAAHLRELSQLTKDAARICDAIFHEIAYQGGLSSRSGASPHAIIVTDAIAGNLEFELRDRADDIEEGRRSEAAGSREHSTLNGCQQGIRTTFARARG
jgi:hypothetical protein